jgi:hypothetical protein
MMNERKDILPGVSAGTVPPVVVLDSQRAVRNARLRAITIDALQVAMLIVVDYLFVHFPATHVPFAGRQSSVNILIAVNILMIGYVIVARSWPRLRARRIANTWAPGERSRFLERR